MQEPKFIKEQNLWQIYVPRNSECLFLAVVLAYLIPVRNDYHSFKSRYEKLFGNFTSAEIMKDFISNYNPFSVEEIFHEMSVNVLVRQFRERVVEYIRSNKEGFNLGDNSESYLSNMKLPSTWGSRTEIKAISGVLECKIRLFSSNSQHEDFSMKNYRMDKVPELELFHEVPAVGRCGDGNYYSFNLEKNIGIKYQQSVKTDKLLKIFVEKVIEHFEKKVTDYSDEIGIEGKTKNPGKIAKQAKSGADIFKAVPSVGKQVSKLINFPADTVGKRYHRNKAKKIYSVFGKERISSEDLRLVLAEAASDIFQKFENQFLNVTTDGGVERAVLKLAEDAVGRIMNYIKINLDNVDEERVGVSSSFITQCVIYGSSKEGMGATVTPKMLQNVGSSKMPKSGRTVKYVKNNVVLKTSEIYEMTGIVKREDDVIKYYEKKGGNAEKIGYRYLFDWELDRWKEMKRQYVVCEPPHREEYILKSKEVKEKVDELLREISKKDQSLQLDKIKDVVVKGNEELHELKLGQGAISDQIEALPSKIAVMSFKKTEDRKPVWYNMRESVSLFTGRVGELEELKKKLQNEGRQVVISQVAAVIGLGGIGKSELARKFSQEYNENYDNNIIWINSETQESLRGSFKELAKELKITTRDEIDGIMQEKSIKTIVRDVYKYFGEMKSLFIFDNAEEYKDIRDYLPYSLHRKENKPYILITSRNREWKVGEEGKIEVISLGEFQPEEAQQFVKDFLKIKDDSQNESIKSLTKELQYFPLALRQAVVYIENENEKSIRRGGNGFSINDYLKKYQENVGELLGHEESDRYTKTVLTTWITTLKKVVENQDFGEQAVSILNVMAFYAPDRLTLKEIFSMSDTDDRWEAVELLDQYSMIDLKNGVSDIHRLVQQVTRLKLEKGKKDEEVLKEALRLINAASLSDVSIGHVISVWDYASKYCKLINEFYFNRKYGYNCATPLHLLAESGSYEAVMTLLQHLETDHPNKFYDVVNAKDRYNRTALYLAAENGHSHIVKLLVDKKTKLDTKCTIAYDSLSTKKASDWTSLHVSSFNGHLDVVKILVDGDKELVNIEDSLRRTPAVLGATGGHVDIVEFLKPGDHVFLLHVMFRVARKNGNLKYLKKYLEDLERENHLQKIVDLKLGEWAPLHLAAFADWLEIARILIKNGAKVRDTQNSFTPLHAASSNGHLNIVTFLIGNGADPKDINKDGWTSLHAAAQNGHLNVTKFFIDELTNEKSIDVNVTDKKLDTPLHTAAFHGKLNVVKFLLQRKANINAVNILGETPLFSAALDNHRDVLEFLMKEGAKVSHTSNSKTLIGRLNISVLHVAAAYDDVETIENLIQKGVDKDIGRNISLTPLHVAAFFGSSKTIKCLIEKDADTKACANVSEILSVLLDAQKDVTLRVCSMNGVVKRLIGFTGYFTSLIKLAPGDVYEIANPLGNDFFGERQMGLLSKPIKWLLSLDRVQKLIENIKTFVKHRQITGFNRPIDGIIITGDGFGINTRDSDGNTVLHLAVKEGKPELVKYLTIEKEADPTILNHNNETALDLAKEKLIKDPENDDLKRIVDILNQRIPSPGII